MAALDVSQAVLHRMFEVGGARGHTVAKLDGDFAGLRDPAKEIRRTVPFTRLPDEIFGAAPWKPVARGRWRRADHITLGEGRVVVKLARMLALSARAHRSVVFTLQDNMPIAGAMSKGRSPAFPLNLLCRQKAASCLASRVKMLIPWCETSKQPADWLSRLI